MKELTEGIRRRNKGETPKDQNDHCSCVRRLCSVLVVSQSLCGRKESRCVSYCIPLKSLYSLDHRKVTCGSGIKLTHVSTGFKLHSHEVKYGSGSGQQVCSHSSFPILTDEKSITAFPNADDPNSLFMIYEGFKHKPCSRGYILLSQPISTPFFCI